MRVLRTLNGADGEGLSVLLLGNDRPTVPVAAALHRMNYRVIVTRDCGKGYAQFSRHVSETWDHPPIEADAMFFSALGKFLRSRPDIRVVLPLWERCVTNLARHRHLLPADRLYACVDDETMETCLDKSKMLSLAMECGMANAAFTTVATYPSLIKATRAIGFPLVIRPTDPNRKLAGKKALIADNARDLVSMLPIWPDGHKGLIAQRYIDGRRINLYFAAQNGKPIRYLATEILRTDELEGTGQAIEGRTIELDADIKRHGDALIERLGYHGVGTIQFLRDRGSSKLFFLELNPRIAGNHAVPEACGLQLGPLALFLAEGDVHPKTLVIGRPGKRYVWTFGALGGIYRALRARTVSPFFACRFLGRMVFNAVRSPIHMTWRWTDPLPALATAANHIPIVSWFVEAASRKRKPATPVTSSVDQFANRALR